MPLFHTTTMISQCHMPASAIMVPGTVNLNRPPCPPPPTPPPPPHYKICRSEPTHIDIYKIILINRGFSYHSFRNTYLIHSMNMRKLTCIRFSLLYVGLSKLQFQFLGLNAWKSCLGNLTAQIIIVSSLISNNCRQDKCFVDWGRGNKWSFGVGKNGGLR